jgi:hypothetical protein
MRSVLLPFTWRCPTSVRRNSTAGRLWRRLADGVPLDLALNEATDHFTGQGAEREAVRADLTALAEQLQDAGLQGEVGGQRMCADTRRVRRGFRNLHAKAGSPASAPKPTRPGPGRPPGLKNRRPALRHDVGGVLATGEVFSRPAHHKVGTKPRRTAQESDRSPSTARATSTA